MAIQRVGVLTSGGDCGGLNAVLKGVALTAFGFNVPVSVIPNGYAGLYNLVDKDSLVELTLERVDAISASLAGSEAGHSRVKIAKINDPNKYQRITDGLRKHGIDALVISGGDDTGSVVVDLDKNKIKCVHAPKTMDLDLQPYSVGADSTINRIANFVRDLRTTALTHNRMFVIEVFGRYAGHTAFRGGVAAEADCILIPEIAPDFDFIYADAMAKYETRVRWSDVDAGTYIIVAAEGIRDAAGNFLTEGKSKDAFGHEKLSGAGKYIVDEIKARMEQDKDAIAEFMREQGMFVPGIYEIPEIRDAKPGHLVRCGQTSAYDVNFGMQIGSAAFRALMHDHSGVTIVDVVGDEIQMMRTEEAIKQRHVDLNMVALYEGMGFSFGRPPVEYNYNFAFVGENPRRHL